MALPPLRLGAQLRSIAPLALRLHLPVVLGFIAVVAAAWKTGTGMADLCEDPAGRLQFPFYMGFVSNVGALFWCAGATVALFTAVLLRLRGGDKRYESFFWFGGMFTAWLMVDDFFLFHDSILPDYLGLPEKLYPPVYAGLNLYFLWRYRNVILETDFVLLLGSLGLFALSIFFDITEHGAFDVLRAGMRSVFEEGTKLLGIVTWFGYFAHTAVAKLQPTSR